MLRNTKRILLLCPDLNEVGGIGVVSRMVLTALQSYPVAGEVWSYRGTTASATGWRHRYANGNRLRYGTWGLGAALAGARETLVVTTHLQLAPVAWPLVKRGARLVVFLHGIEAWVPLRGLRAAMLARADLLMANSHYTVRRFKEINPRFADAVVPVCHLGVPAVAEQPVATEPFALIVGRLAERTKGHDLLLELWPQVQQRFPAARLVIAGDGGDRARLEQKARDLGVATAVVFKGRVPNDELQRLYRQCAFFVMPSSTEGFGLVFLEAMRASKACIGWQGAPEEVIEHEVTGLIAGGQSPRLVDAVTRLLADPVLCTNMGQAGRERFDDFFTETHFQERFLTTLEAGLK